MSFSAEWLTLREPADHAARDPALLAAFRNRITPETRILDLGSGTGSTLRAVDRPARWTLIDNDPELLAKAAGHHPEAQILQTDLAAPLPKADALTASALFDLCSASFVKRLDIPDTLYAALNYDGEMHWSVSHPQDAAVTAAFNADQRRDKGFGPALGPDATALLATTCRAAGMQVHTAESPWILPQGPLQAALLHGIADATNAPQDWLDFRLNAEGSCHVGHLDLLAMRV